MTPTDRTLRERTAEALEHIEFALAHSHRDLSEQITIDAIAPRLSAGLEALGVVNILPNEGPQWSGMKLLSRSCPSTIWRPDSSDNCACGDSTGRARGGYWTRSAGSPSRRMPSTFDWLVTFILFQFSRIGRGHDCHRATSAISMNSSTSCSRSVSMLWAHHDLPVIIAGRSEAPGGSEGAVGGCAIPWTTAVISGIRGALAKKIQWREAAVRRPPLRWPPKEDDY